MEPNSSTYVIGGGLTFHQRVVHLWLLDFNQCKEIEMNDTGVTAAVEAFALNDRYFPRPSVDANLWKIFCNQYQKTSERIIASQRYKVSQRWSSTKLWWKCNVV